MDFSTTCPRDGSQWMKHTENNAAAADFDSILAVTLYACGTDVTVTDHAGTPEETINQVDACYRNETGFLREKVGIFAKTITDNGLPLPPDPVKPADVKPVDAAVGLEEPLKP